MLPRLPAEHIQQKYHQNVWQPTKENTPYSCLYIDRDKKSKGSEINNVTSVDNNRVIVIPSLHHYMLPMNQQSIKQLEAPQQECFMPSSYLRRIYLFCCIQVVKNQPQLKYLIEILQDWFKIRKYCFNLWK